MQKYLFMMGTLFLIPINMQAMLKSALKGPGTASRNKQVSFSFPLIKPADNFAKKIETNHDEPVKVLQEQILIIKLLEKYYKWVAPTYESYTQGIGWVAAHDQTSESFVSTSDGKCSVVYVGHQDIYYVIDFSNPDFAHRFSYHGGYSVIPCQGGIQIAELSQERLAVWNFSAKIFDLNTVQFDLINNMMRNRNYEFTSADQKVYTTLPRFWKSLLSIVRGGYMYQAIAYLTGITVPIPE